jgi:photosystem I P700 chlorophyll a apoprotein A1
MVSKRGIDAEPPFGGSLGLGSLAWAGHQIHVSLPINKLLDAGIDPKKFRFPMNLF